MSAQPEALRLADQLEIMSLSTRWDKAAAIELRRLHAANIDCVDHFNAIKAERDELLDALEGLMYWDNGKPEWEVARAVIAKATN